jgi:hypothetical protein
MSILVVNGCIATLLNREILIENYWDENEDVCYRQYKDELKTFMRSYVKPLSMSIDQLIAFYIRHQPRIYHPVCRQMIRKNELIPVSWPPEHASRSGDDDSLIRPHQLDVLSLFSTYTQFVSFIRSYLAR